MSLRRDSDGASIAHRMANLPDDPVAVPGATQATAPPTSPSAAIPAAERLRLLRDGIANCSGQLLSGLVALVMIPIMLRFMGVEGYGLWVAAWTLSSLIWLSDFGLEWSMVREISLAIGAGKEDSAPDLVASAFSANFWLAVPGALAVAAVGYFLPDIFQSAAPTRELVPMLLALVGAASIADRVTVFLSSVLKGMRRFGTGNMLMVLLSVVRAVGTAIVLVAGGGLLAVAAWYLAGGALVALLATAWTRRIDPRYRFSLAWPRWTPLRPQLRYGLFCEFNVLSARLLHEVPALLVAVLRGAAAVTPFYVAQRLPVILAAFSHNLASAMSPAASRYQGANAAEATRDLLRSSTRWLMALNLPVGTLLLLLAPAILARWIGHAAPDTVLVWRLTTLAVMFEGFGVAGSEVMIGRGALSKVLWINLTVATATVAATAALVPSMGIVGAGWALLFPSIVGCFWSMLWAAQECGLPFGRFARKLVPGMTLPLLASILPVAALLYWRPTPGWAGLVATSAVGGFLFLAVFYTGSPLPDERHTLQELGRALREWLLPSGAGVIQNQPAPPASGSIAVAICTKDRPQKLRRCLQSLAPLRSQLLQLIVVDNRSVTAETRAAAEEFGASYFREDRPGLFAARNCALRNCQADFLAFTDDDCEADPGWIAAILVGLSDPETACVTGRATSPPGTANWLQQRFDVWGRGFCRPFPYQVTPERVRGIFQRALVGVGANMAFRREVLQQLQGFPDRLTGDAADDNYIFYKVLSGGWRIQYMPESLVYEEHRSRLGDVLRRWFQYGVGNVQVMAQISLEQGDPSFLLRNVLWMVSAMLYGWLQSVSKRTDTIAGLLFQLVSVWFSIAGMMWELPFARCRLGHDRSRLARDQVPERKGPEG
ncbi:MAG: glycosyltransferase [Acidobacteriota bacterium]|nr:glycosyltransferase [Acidobacteriota bacterium]